MQDISTCMRACTVTGTHAPHSTVASIQAAICARYGITRLEMLSSRRSTAIVHARWIAIWLCRRSTRLSLPALGRLFDSRHHTTIMHALRQVDAEMAAVPSFDAEMRAMLFVAMAGEGVA